MEKSTTLFFLEYDMPYYWRLEFDGQEVFALDKKDERIFELEKYTMDIEVDRFCGNW